MLQPFTFTLQPFTFTLQPFTFTLQLPSPHSRMLEGTSESRPRPRVGLEPLP